MAGFDITGFWDGCDAVLARIREEQPDTVDAVAAILNDFLAPSSGLAFFDSGGGDCLDAALDFAGWDIYPIEHNYLWDARHPGTGEELCYVEGDVYRGRYRRP